MKRKLAIVTSHPIQYNAPFFKLMAQRGIIGVKVFYTWGESSLKMKYDPGFNKIIDWDIPLLEGYEYEFLKNDAIDKGSHHFKGIVNPDIIQKINEYQPNAILVIGWSFKSHLQVMRHFKGKIPVLFRGDSTLLNKASRLKNIIRSTVLKWIYRHIDVALYVGQNNYQYYLRSGLKPGQLVHAAHAIENERFTLGAKASENNFRKNLGIHKDSLVFLFAGKLEPNKYPELLFTAFVETQFPNPTELVIVGDGPLEKELRNQFESYDKIHFVEFQNQSMMPLVYEMADVYVLPSRSETWGLALNEAMACGKAVIASDMCGAAVDVIRNDVNGYIFKAGDLDDLKNALLRIASRQKASEMGTASLSIIKDFSFLKIAEAVENTVLRLSNSRR